MRSNFVMQLHGCDERNAVYVLPRSHAALRRLDIPALLAEQGLYGGDVLPDAVPLIAEAGDVVCCFRNALHCSFPNASERLRITFNFGFHRRKWVDAAWCVCPLSRTSSPPLRFFFQEMKDRLLTGAVLCNLRRGAETVAERCQVVPVAMDCRRQRFPSEPAWPAFEFRAPHPLASAGPGELMRWDGWEGKAGPLMATPRLSL